MKRKYTPEEREAARLRDQKLVKDSVEQLRSSEGWQQWLRTRSRMHNYSLHNQLLIAIQHPTATRVASFNNWLKLGYSVKKAPDELKGHYAIKVWAPMKPSKKQLEQALEDGTGRPRTFFKLVNVFAQDQVEPMPPPAKPAPLDPPVQELEGDSMADAMIPLVAFAGTIGSDVALEPMPDERGGYYRPLDKHIGLNEDHSINARVRTLIHELAHALIRADKQEGDPELDRGEEELVVESVALSVCHNIGFDTSAMSIPYLVSWSDDRDMEVVEAAAKLINRLACRLEDVFEQHEPEEQAKPLSTAEFTDDGERVGDAV